MNWNRRLRWGAMAASPVVGCLVLLSSGCMNSGKPAGQELPTFITQSWFLNPIVAPSEMDWIVLKLEAQCRIPWSCQGFTYRLDYRKGNAFGEVEARVTYLAPTNQAQCSEMSAAIIHALNDGEGELGGEFHSDAELRSRLHMRTYVTRMAGRPLPLVDSMADSVVDLRPELGCPQEQTQTPAAGSKIHP